MGLTQSLNSKANVKKSTTQDIPFSPLFPVVNRTTPASTTAAQTVFNLNFSVDTINNPDSTFMVIDGKTLSPGVGNDFQFTAVNQQGYSSQITLNAGGPPLPAGLNWFAYKLGVRKEAEFNMDNRFVQLYAAQGEGFQGFVDTSTSRTATSTPGSPAAGTFYSSIPNRAPIVDISQDLKASLGTDRFTLQTITSVQNESGPNGEIIWSTPNDDRGLIRFVGTSWNSFSDSTGQSVITSSINDYVEITFYGTDLNLISNSYNQSRDWRATVDGGTEGSNFYTSSSASTIINSQGYASNIVFKVISGLALGVHTVKIRNNAALPMPIYGFEFLNTNSGSLITINSGVSYSSGQKLTSSSSMGTSYNSTFESGTLGTRGGHVVVYQKADGSIGKAVTPTNVTQANLTSADHTNEEVQRVYNWREFGAGRSDDFSYFIGSNINLNFTLDDGTTTLNAINAVYVPSASAISVLSVSGNRLVLTFIGTGLDLVRKDSGSGTSDIHNVIVDGISIGNTSGTAITNDRILKIVSGLPYGTHTVSFNYVSSGTYYPGYKSFIVYQPKKPSIPQGAVELAEYNIMATYVANTLVASGAVSSGVIKKYGNRELSYVGAGWNALGSLGSGYSTGYTIQTTTTGDYVEYVFVGTGVEARWGIFNSNNATSVAVTIDGASNLSGYTTSTYGTASAFIPSTGVLNENGTGTSVEIDAGLSISNIPYGVHKIRMTYTSGGSAMQISGFDVITPIYSPRSNLNYDLQSTLSVGSSSISDSRKTSPIKNIQAQRKIVVQAGGISSSASTSSTVLVPCPDMVVTVNSPGDWFDVYFSYVGYPNTSTSAFAQIYVNGISVGPYMQADCTSSMSEQVSVTVSVYLPKGVNLIQGYWKTGSGTISNPGIERYLRVSN
jgi:hypothetical protein